MRFTLALATLGRHRGRTVLAVIGVAVAFAMLLDMVMLSSGLRASFRDLLLSRGFQLRLSPKGTLPFDTEATIGGAADLLATLQGMRGAEATDAVSLIMVRLRGGAIVDAAQRRIQSALPRVDVISTSEAMARVDQRLSYFRQLSFILGAVSLVVGFLLVTTLVTVSVNERLGEIAVMRAIGVSRVHVVEQVVLESGAIVLGGAALGLGLGLLTARYLNHILSSFPGLPAAIDFFLFQPRAVWTALGLLALCGIAASVYPAWRAAVHPVAGALREEAVA